MFNHSEWPHFACCRSSTYETDFDGLSELGHKTDISPDYFARKMFLYFTTSSTPSTLFLKYGRVK